MLERRLARVAITYELLFEWLTQDNLVAAIQTTKGLPSDATFLYSYSEDKSGQVYMVFEHPSFDAVTIGSEIPIILIEFTRYHGATAYEMLAESMKQVAVPAL